MFIKKLSGYENRYCEHCGRFKGRKDDDKNNLTSVIYGLWITENEKPDYMLCKNCFSKLTECVKNIDLTGGLSEVNRND